ncbi:MAG: NAD-dependent epimerase/dehydratase family protein [Polyangiaceae bacterium]|jgi:UDP-glucose 4-epimerase
MALHLITGGAGFIGSSIAEALVARGDSVRIVDDFSSGRLENLEGLGGRFDLVRATVADPVAIGRAMQGVDVVFHQAAIPSVVRSVEDPIATMLVGVQGTTVVLDAARRAGARRVVLAASSAAYGDGPILPKVESMPPLPLSPYATSKVAGEYLMRVFAELYGIETVSLRYFNVFGPHQDPKSEYAAVIPKFITAAIRRQRPTVFGDGEQTRDFCYIDNVVTANLLSADTPRRLRGEVLNIACGQRMSLNRLIAEIGEVTGVRLEPEYRPPRPGDVRDSVADIRAAHEALGYEPTVTVSDGLKLTFEALSRASHRTELA